MVDWRRRNILKKIITKTKKILFNDIESISEGIVSALIFETFKSDAIIIKGKGNSKIIILKTKYVQKNKIYEIIKLHKIKRRIFKKDRRILYVYPILLLV